MLGVTSLETQHITGADIRTSLANNSISVTPYNGKHKYLKSGAAASMFQQTFGAFNFYSAPAGTAGDEIAFTEIASLTSTGNLVLGGTLPASPNITLKADGNINAKGAVARVYADNTAAKAAGLVDGDIYRTATGQLMIVFT